LVADLVEAADQVEAVVLAAEVVAAAVAAAVLEAIQTRWAEGVVIKTTLNRLPS
jgi:hypothetical protein